MATSQQAADFIVEQIQGAGDIRVRKMFGEYGLYCDDKVVALICDDMLYIKPSDASGPYLAGISLAPPYPGAKDYLRVNDECMDDSEWLTRFVRDTAAVLPLPKPKKPKK